VDRLAVDDVAGAISELREHIESHRDGSRQ
jgi:hypothetical protein